MNICVIGNSHLAAVMLGWKQIQSKHPGVEFTFFGAPGSHMQRLRVSERSLIPKSPKLLEFMTRTSSKREISGDYDYYVVCGLQFRVFKADHLFSRYRSESHARDERIPLSDDCFFRTLYAQLSDCEAGKTIVKLKKITSSPIVMMPQPMCAEGYTEIEWLTRAESNRDDRSIAKFFDQACRKFGEELGVRVVVQPEVTKSRHLRTKAIYSRGACKLRAGATSEGQDFFHMNADFGAVMIRQALPEIWTRGSDEPAKPDARDFGREMAIL